MREIKFRAFIKTIRQMVKVYAIDFRGSIIMHEDMDWDMRMNHEIPVRQESFLSDCVLMQYTGLTDKNNTEIYKGDIVKAWIDFGPAGEEQRNIEIKITPFGCNLQKWTYKEEGYLPKVIGNIYENPELLKE